MPEILLCLMLVLCLGTGVLEFSHARNIAQILDLALLDALRAGASDHASPASMAQAFENALQTSRPDAPGQARGTRLAHALQQRRHASGTAAWRLDILNPTPAGLADHTAPLRPGSPASGVLVYFDQTSHHQERLARGWPDGRGPLSGQSVFEANLLQLRARYLHAPMSAAGRLALKLLGALLPAADAESARIAQAGLWPMYRTAAIPMGSEAWPWRQRQIDELSLSSGTVTAHDTPPLLISQPLETEASPDTPDASTPPSSGLDGNVESPSPPLLTDPATDVADWSALDSLDSESDAMCAIQI